MAPSALDKLGYEREAVADLLELIDDDIKKNDVTPLSEADIINHLSDIANCRVKLHDIHGRIRQQTPTDIDKHVDDYKLLLRSSNAVENALHGIKANLQRPVPTTASAVPHHGANTRLPKLDLKSFDGDLLEWTSFRDMFESTIHNNVSVPKVQKLTYLKSLVKGEAARQIQTLILNESNYDIAWSQLHDRYQNNREILFSILKRLFNLTVVNPTSAAMRSLIDTTKESLRSLEILSLKTEPTTEAIVMFLLVSKLDPVSRALWEQTLKGTSIPPLSDVYEFLEQRARALAASDTTKPRGHKPEEPHKKFHAHFGQDSQKCKHCNDGFHPLFKCQKFITSSLPQKYEVLKKLNLCFNCFGGHSVSNCNSSGRCKTCKGKHNSLLHKQVEESRSSGSNNQQQPVSQPPLQFANHSRVDMQPSQGMLATAIICVLGGDGQYHSCRAFLDGGSTASFITDKCIRRLGLQKSKSTAQVVGLAACKVGTARGVTTLVFSPHFNPGITMTVNALALSKVTNHMPVYAFNQETCAHLHNLTLADPNWNKPAAVDVLLGADIFWSLILGGRKHGTTGHPIGIESSIGWLVAGTSNQSQNIVQVHYADSTLDKQLQTFWEIESIPNQHVLTKEEEACDLHFQSTHSRDRDGRFTVSIPFRFPRLPLGSSRETAFRRLKSLERRLSQNPQYQQQYLDFMREYQAMGHMSPMDSLKSEVSAYFIPHHFVLKEESTTTKFRVVFDASSKTSTGHSLNETMMVGPPLQDSLMDIILRFRLYPYAFTADIAKMYRQIKVSESDLDYQRILWRESPADEVKEYQLSTVTYGTALAPYLAVKCLQQLARDEAESFPLAAEVLLKDFYVDDLMTSSPSIPIAKETQHQLLQLTDKGSFPLRKWASNCEELLNDLPAELRESQTSFDLSIEPSVKALGIRWNTRRDHFEFRYADSSTTNSTPYTKRKILSEMSKLFDPLGWVAPVVIRAKIFMQSLWRLDVSWDDPLPPQAHNYWTDLKSDLLKINQLTIPRCQIPNKPYHIHLAGFCDASELAYAAVVYLCVYMDEGTKISLIASKTRVAPASQLSIPRLELCGAVLLAALMDSVHAALNINIDSQRAWTDSTDVLAWLKSQPSKWKTFIANRVAEIQRCKLNLTWGHVPGVQNPADCASRGLSVADILHFPLWWNGPLWLQTYKVHGPSHSEPEIETEKTSDAVSKEIKPVKLTCAAVQVETSTLLHSKSNLDEVIRISAWLIRFCHNSKLKTGRTFGPLQPAELHTALIRWVKFTQQQSFPQEISYLESGKQLSFKSKILSLNPFICPDGLLRVGGRLRHADLPVDRKHPLLLPRHSRLTELIISNLHSKYLHAGPNLLLSLIQQRFWIVRAKDAIRFHIRKCIRCTRQAAVTQSQFMGDLPASRVNPSPPFQKCGVDYAGPFQIRPDLPRSRVSIKAYLAIFVFFTTKAFHLELVNSLSTDSFLAALRRFVARRGLPSHIYSDCGTNFVGANKELKEMLQLFRSSTHNNQVADALTADGISWKFNPPGAPHFGGLWEAGVKSVKFHLHRVLGPHRLTYEELYTTLVQVEACLNSRPLTCLSNDPSDFAALTSGHFLIGQPLLAVPEPSLMTLSQNKLSRWQLAQRFQQQFWKRWSAEYLTRLQQRPKWMNHRTDIRVNDMVLIKDDNLPPQRWRLGRVTDVHPGQDGIVRVASVKTADSNFKRPITKLCLLPIQNITDDVPDVL